MRTCPRCGRTHPDGVDFCRCGAFLDWEPPAEPDVTRAPPSAGPTTVVIATPPVAGATELVSLTLFATEDSIEGAPVELAVPAGGRSNLIARVRNQSNIVDSYALSIDKLPAAWWTIDPPTAYLLPHGSREGYEEDVVIALHPPRGPEAEARRWSFKVRVTSQSHPTRVAHADAHLDIEPFWQLSAAARPGVVIGRRRGKLVGGVTNAGNAEVSVTIAAADAEGRCHFGLPPAAVAVRPGTTADIPIVVRPRRPHLLGRPIDHRLELVARPREDGAVEAPFPAVYRQRPWIPWWVPLVVLLLAVIALIAYLLWPHRVEVPDVRKARSAFAAQKILEREGLELNPRIRRTVRPGERPGSVVKQAPAPGKKVDEGEDVAIVVAAGRKRVTVPPVAGLRVVDADEKLQDRGLTLGAVTPKLKPKRKIGSQLPRAGVRRRRGSPVSVVLAKRPKKKSRDDSKEDGGSQPGAGPAAVPPVGTGTATAADAAAKLEDAGLEPKIEYRIDVEERDTVLETVPPDGEPPPPDGEVKLIVSAGFPLLAYDTGGATRVVEGFMGWPPVSVKPGASFTTSGSWSPDGTRFAYVRRKRVYWRLLGPDGSAPVTPPQLVRRARPPVRQVAFAPSGVLAFVRRDEEGVAQLCRTDLARPEDKPGCDDVRGWRVNGLSWSSDGTQILLAVKSLRDADDFGLLRVTQGGAGWHVGNRLLATGKGARGVRAAAFAPEGDRVAVVSNLHDGFFRLALTTESEPEPDDSDYLPVQGCDVAWLPDGEQLSVVQGSCSRPGVGPIVRVRLDEPRTLETAVLLGSHPAWQPIDLSFGPGR